MNAYDKLREQLFSDSFALEVMPRKRQRNSTNIVTAGSGALNDFSIQMGQLDVLQPGDGLLIEFASLQLLPANETLILSNAALQLVFIAAGGPFALAPAETQFNAGQLVSGNAGPGSQGLFFKFPVVPALWTSLDLNARTGRAGPLAPGNQPGQFQFSFTLVDSLVGGQSVPIVATVFSRLVRGLQEN